MLKRAGQSRAMLFGLLFALVGFSYVLATPSSDESAYPVGVRAVGTVGNSLVRFTNPFATTADTRDRDLGDVVAGSTFVRFARAAGGLPPYKFSSAGTQAIDSTALKTLISSGAVTAAGKVTGSIVSGTTTDPRFSITVQDAYANTNTVTELFRLTVVSGTLFKFAIGPSLGEAVQFRDFNGSLEVINGRGAVTFGVVSGSVKLDSTTLGSLEEAGLSLSKSGVLFGKPFRSGVVTFSATATDSIGTLAAGRDGTGTSQAFSLTVTANTSISSDFVVQKAQVKFGATDKDSVSVGGAVNLGATAISALSGKSFSLRVGSYTSPAVTFDTKGKATTAKGTKTKIVKVAVNSKGFVKAAVQKETLSTFFPGITGANSLQSTGVTVGDSINTNEILRYNVKISKTTTLKYSIGKDIDLAGAFIVTSVAGKAQKTGGDAFKASFVAIPGATTASAAGTFTGATKAETNIGNYQNPTANQAVTVDSKQKVKSTDKSKTDVKKLGMDGVKGKGSLQTAGLTTAQTGITASTTAGTRLFPLGIRLAKNDNSTVFQGEAGAVIFSAGKGYSSKNPTK